MLAFPTVPLENFQLEPAVTFEVEPKLPSFSQVATHADCRMSRRNYCWCAAERNAKDRRSEVNRTSAFLFSSHDVNSAFNLLEGCRRAVTKPPQAPPSTFSP